MKEKKAIVFATNNKNKIREIQDLLSPYCQIISLEDIGCTEEIPETQPTIEGNAMQKAQYVAEHYHVDCFADDTGLEVKALNGRPGVHSARYADAQKQDSQANINKLLKEMREVTERQARFKTVVALVENGKITCFEGIVEGEILHQRRGEGGFGYDPVFKPQGEEKSFAEMTLEQKNTISHRARAVRKLVDYFKNKA